jgi:hypothetical protein
VATAFPERDERRGDLGQAQQFHLLEPALPQPRIADDDTAVQESADGLRSHVRYAFPLPSFPPSTPPDR